MKIKIFTLFSLIITFSLAITSCNSLWDDLNTLTTVTITYVSDKGTPPVKKEVNIGYRLTAEDLPDLTSDGYKFKGWDKSIDDEITTDTTITASWKKTWKITYVLPSGYSKDPKVVEEGYKLTAEDLPNIEKNDTYYMLNKNVGYEITADTQITGDWDGIVYLNTFSNITDIKNNKAKIEKIVFTSDTYSGAATPIACADNSTNSAIPTDYFKGVLTDGTVSGQYILTIYGNGHRIYAPTSCKQLFNGFSKVSSIEFNNFYTSKVTDMSQMFYTCRALSSLDLSSFDTSSVQTMMGMFGTCIALTSLNISSFNTSNVTDFTGMFSNLNEITELNLSNFDTSKATSMQIMFSGCNKLTSVNISSFNTSLVKNMNGMFANCQAIEYIDVSKLNTSAVTDMAKMFSSCEKLKELNLSGFVTSSVTTMTNMFNSCEKLKELDLSSFDTSSVEQMVSMFQSAKSLERIVFSSNFNTEKVTNMNSMFEGCSNLTTLDVSNFKTEKVTNMKSMFKDCSRLITLDVSKFNTGKVTDMNSMFDGCSSFTTLDISSFTITNVSNIANCEGLFSNCTNLITIYVSSAFDLSSDPIPIIFDGDTKLVGGNGTKYEDIAISNPDHCRLTIYARIDGGPSSSTPGYFTLKQ